MPTGRSLGSWRSWQCWRTKGGGVADRKVTVRLEIAARGDECGSCRLRRSRNSASGYECGLFQTPLLIRDGWTLRLNACRDYAPEARDGE